MCSLQEVKENERITERLFVGLFPFRTSMDFDTSILVSYIDVCGILSSYGGGYEGYCLLGCDAVLSGI
jgi:hypothetical protein